MHIFIDESGLFIPSKSATNKISCVAAVVVPSSQIERLSRRYQRLLRRWNVADSEMKGSKMDEEQVASVIGLLREFDVMSEIVALDTGTIDDERATAFQRLQADKITEQFTESDTGALITELRGLRAEMLALPPQLMLQIVATISLIENILEMAPMYYVQRRPEELSDFTWIVDAKNVAVTTFEKLWSSLILPIVQTASISRPFTTIEGQGYSYFSQYYVSADDYPNFLKEACDRAGGRGDGGVDLRRVLTDRLSFHNSKSEIGLQLADTVASGFSRAMNGNLARPGWSRIGELLVSKPALLIPRVDQREPESTMINAPYGETWNEIASGRRSMLTIQNIRKAARPSRRKA